MKNKKGMTLIEMLVVIGIIGVLAAVLLSQFGGATESAKAAQCMNNMRTLSQGVINAASVNDMGHYPSAMSFKQTPQYDANGKIVYYTKKGWLSWTRSGDTTSKSEGAIIKLGEASDDTLQYALTNGAIWTAVGRSRSAYLCPVHSKMFKDKNGREAGWSFAMNYEFGCPGYGRWPVLGESIVNGAASDKVLMFAEIQGITVPNLPPPDESGQGPQSDPILKYKDGETIGFNHKISGGKYMGHVAFADGHVDKLMLPKSGSINDLTKWLCTGVDITFNGSIYNQVTQ